MNKKQANMGRPKNERNHQLASPGKSNWSRRWDHKSIAFSLMIAIGLMAVTMGEFAQGETIIYDNWNDGMSTSWVPWFGDYDASSGDLEMEKDSEHFGAQVWYENDLLDASIRVQASIIRLVDPPPGPSWDPDLFAIPDAAIVMRVTQEHSIWAGVQPDGQAHLAQNGTTNWTQIDTDLSPLEEDVVMQLDVFGSDVKFWVWRPGDRRPDQPIIQMDDADDPFMGSGHAGIAALFTRSVFRYTHIADSSITDLPGDFNADWTLTVDDVDQLMTAIRTGQSVPLMDLNINDLVDTEDLRIWVKDLRGTWFGDANLDGEFNSGDLVDVFERGKYGSAASWAEGDWNADGLFDSGDLVVAFQDNGYGQGPLPTVAAVPEPTALSLMGVALTGLIFLARRKAAPLPQTRAWR